jgi:hypothetical protein
MHLRTRRALGALLLLSPVLAFLVAKWIVTDAEAVETTIEDAVSAADRRDWDALGETISEAYSKEGRDREGVVAYVRREVTKTEPIGLRVSVHDVVVDGDTAKARADVRFAAWSRPFVAQVDVRLRKEDGTWRIVGAWLGSWD